VIDRLGNLTLLGKRFNTSIKNADFATKKERAYADSDILMTKELLDRDDWSAQAIDERQRSLGTWVFDIWHFPGEEQPAELADANQGADSSTSQGEADADIEQLPEVPTG
jgi:hypothetical protein